MILAYAGRLPGSADFPDDNVENVAEQIERLLVNLRPRLVVGSGAAGADLLVLAAAFKSAAKAKVVLAGTAAEFRHSSVARRGRRWESLFDAVLSHPQADVVEVPRLAHDSESYAAVTARIGELAEREAVTEEPIVVLNVSAAREGLDHSASLATSHELRGRLVMRIDPARRANDIPVAFVAMPFGRRTDLARGWREYDADATYNRIILPALIDSGYRPVRADTEALLEVIDLTMLREINRADVVVADLATLNPNVMWEVGVRHAWRRSGTILIRPKGTVPPFDVSHARVHEYARDESGVSDVQSAAGILLLRELLGAASDDRVDSPVFLTLPSLPEARLADGSASEAQRAVRERIDAITLAADLRDPSALQALATEIADDRRLETPARSLLLEQVGLALIGAGRHAAAVPILRPLAEADVAMEHVRLQQQYAHALIRSDSPNNLDQRLATAEARLRALLERSAPSGETFGLLGSAAKARVEIALSAGNAPGPHLDVAIDAYMNGFRRDPGDYYPGIVALALMRLRGQRIRPNEQDVAEARQLLPVVRFAATRLGEPTDDDIWRLATVAELHLHEYMLEANEEALAQATSLYARVGAVGGPNARASAARQLRLFRDAGDPPGVVADILTALEPPGDAAGRSPSGSRSNSERGERVER